MSGVNIFGEPLSTNKKKTIQRGPAGIGFKYLDAEGNFDIDKKRLANVADPIVQHDAANRSYIDKEIARLWDSYEAVRLDQLSLMDMHNELDKRFMAFLTANEVDQQNLKNDIRNLETFDSNINEKLTLLQNQHLALESGYELTKNKLEKDYVNKTQFANYLTDVLLEFKNGIENTLSNLKAEVFGEITKKYDDLIQKIEELSKTMPKSIETGKDSDIVNETNRHIDLPIVPNSGNISKVSHKREFDTDIASNSGTIRTVAGPVNRGNVDLDLESNSGSISVVMNDESEKKDDLEEKGIDTVN